MNAAHLGTATNTFYLCMPPPPPRSLGTVISLNMRMRARTSVSFSFSPCKRKSRRFSVAFDAGLVIKTPQGLQQSSDVEIPSESVVRRRLILLRHAESSWENRSLREAVTGTLIMCLRNKLSNGQIADFLIGFDQLPRPDHDRPLSNIGLADAVKVSKKLLLLGWIPELILSSDAQRTRETLKIMQEEVQGFSDAEVHFLSSFYSVAAMDGQTAEHLQQSICEYSRDEILTVMCMGHNRGWEEAASMLSGVSVELKTCNAALLEATGKSWEEAFSLAGFGGWKLLDIVKPDTSL